MGTLLMLELRKLLTSRSAKIALLVCFLVPLLWGFANTVTVANQLNVALKSGWQMPAVSLGLALQYVFPLFIAILVAEMIGTEVAQGTLAPLLLRPVNRTKVILAKLIIALLIPFILVACMVLGSLLVGLPRGLGAFEGGTGLGLGLFAGTGGVLSPLAALGEVIKGGFLASYMLMPVAMLSLLYGILFLNTSSAALATIATFNLMRLLIALPEGLQRVLLTNHFALYVEQDGGRMVESMILLLIYTVGFGAAAIFAFDRRDV